MIEQAFARDIAFSLLEPLRSKYPEQTFFIKRRNNTNLGIIGFVQGSIVPECLYFTFDSQTNFLTVNEKLPTAEKTFCLTVAKQTSSLFNLTTHVPTVTLESEQTSPIL